MAYILTGHVGRGPFPNQAGEFVGNYRASETDGACGWFDSTRHRLGRPHPVAESDTVSSMEAQGWRGKYLIATEDPSRNITAVGAHHGILDGAVVLVHAVENGWVQSNPSEEPVTWLAALKKRPADFCEPAADAE
jgi:hypothetical protein